MTNSRTSGQVLIGQIIDSKAAFSRMKETVLSLKDADVWIISAYLRKEALETLAYGLDSSNRVKVLVRWQANDILSGASDLESYEFSKIHTWQFYARQDLHAKAYRLGSEAIYVGSANLTNNGFSLAAFDGNAEAVVMVEVTPLNLSLLHNFFERAVLINDKLISEIRAYLAGMVPRAFSACNAETWPLIAAELELPPVEGNRIMVSECFWTNGDWINTPIDELDENVMHDMSLLGFSNGLPLSEHFSMVVTMALQDTKIFRWLDGALQAEKNGEMYFGRITALLHDALLDDPLPYRSEVKVLLANLLVWIQIGSGCGLIVDRPSHSERVSLLKHQ